MSLTTKEMKEAIPALESFNSKITNNMVCFYKNYIRGIDLLLEVLEGKEHKEDLNRKVEIFLKEAGEL